MRVLASSSRSETVYRNENFDAALTRETTTQALADAGITAAELDVIELHDAFTVEELLYVEAMGLCPEGHAADALEAGEFDVGGRIAISPSGGLLSMGHPIGPTGIGQICEIVTQLRGEAGARQHAGARTGLAHMVGVGAVCLVHILHRSE
jgi:acetyl-CoA acetyltransferase